MLLVFVPEAGALAAGDPEKGKDVALKWCARCHVIGDYNVYGGIDSTPWFRTFARKPETYPPERIRTFSERPPHPPLKIDVSDREMADLIAFIATLKDK
ncbi:MAG: hypothetical protein ACE5H8_14470 [Alphaproteobacteria bacterium]